MKAEKTKWEDEFNHQHAPDFTGDVGVMLLKIECCINKGKYEKTREN